MDTRQSSNQDPVAATMFAYVQMYTNVDQIKNDLLQPLFWALVKKNGSNWRGKLDPSSDYFPAIQAVQSLTTTCNLLALHLDTRSARANVGLEARFLHELFHAIKEHYDFFDLEEDYNLALDYWREMFIQLINYCKSENITIPHASRTGSQPWAFSEIWENDIYKEVRGRILRGKRNSDLDMLEEYPADGSLSEADTLTYKSGHLLSGTNDTGISASQSSERHSQAGKSQDNSTAHRRRRLRSWFRRSE